MKKILFCVFALFAGMGLFAQQGSELTIWSFTDELAGIIDNYYKSAHPGESINYTTIPTDRFESELDPVMASRGKVPDIFALEAYFVRKYVESGLLMDLTDIYEANKDKLLAYPVKVGSYKGRVYALSWQSCPGAMFYRRSLAKKYLGTDNPQDVQNYFNDINKFIETAEFLKRRSNGTCVVVSSGDELFRPFLGARRQPWVVNGKLVIDPIMEAYMDMRKIMYDNGWEGYVGQWSDGWFSGMRGELRDENGKRLETFAYFLPTWGLHYVLKPNTPETSGDWAMIPGPTPYYWGGTWIGAWKGSKNVAAVKAFISYIAADDVFLERYVMDSGEFVNNLKVVDKIKNNFREPFLGGQNHYAAFAEIAKSIDGSLIQATDAMIEDIFIHNVSAYVNREKTKAQALADFRWQVETQLGIK